MRRNINNNVNSAIKRMQKKTHLAFGLLIFTIFFYFDKQSVIYFWAPFIGAVVPDLDILEFFRKWHRVLFHNIIFLWICVIALWLIRLPSVAIEMFTLGFISHILLDCMTVTGINILQPFSQEPNIKWFIETGSWMDYAVFVLLVFISGIILINSPIGV